MTFSWLHLTDLHLGMDQQSSLLPALKDRFFEDLKSLHDRCGDWDLVIFSGDLTQSGKVEEYEQLDLFLGQMWERFRLLGCKPSFLAVPGNHDLVRPNAKSPEVKLLSQWADDPDVQSEFWSNPGSPYRATVEAAFRNYREWWDRAPHRPPIHTGILPGDFSATIEKEGVRLGIVGLNSTFLQLTGGDYTGRLAVHASQFNKVCEDDGPKWIRSHRANLLVTHQPPDWLTPDAREQLRAEITGYGYFVVHLFGHMHDARYVSSAEGGAPICRTSQGTSLFGLEYVSGGKTIDRRHGYAAGRIKIEGSTGSYSLWPRDALKASGQWNFGPDREFHLTDDHIKEESFDPFPAPDKLSPALAGPSPSASPSPSGPAEPPADTGDCPFPKKWAILIGVDEYPYVPKLHYCRNDVVELGCTLRDTLEFPRECVFEFHEESELKPERLQIFRKLGELRDSGQVGENDLLLFYFSGHGMNAGNKDYLLPIEASAKDVKTLGISVESLVSSLKETGSKNVAMFIDACRELDTGSKGTVSLGADSADVVAKEGIVAFFSCDPRDRSYEIDALKHGSFSYGLLEAIKQGFENVSQLEGYLRKRVPQINTSYLKPPQQPYAVFQPPERGSLKILYNRKNRIAAAQRFDSLITALLDLLDSGTIDNDDFNGALEFLVQMKETQPGQEDKTKLHLVESLAKGKLNAKAFHAGWQIRDRARSAAPQIQSKLPRLGGQL
ncbi:MAG: caspase family protein [Bryobacteraceae bacterium]|jgi:predicted MPP superfamily phosphohydrolase